MKSLLLTAAVAALAFTGCATEDTPVGPEDLAVKFSTEISSVTRTAPTIKKNFEDGDKFSVTATSGLGAAMQTSWMDGIVLSKTGSAWSSLGDTYYFKKGYKYSFSAYSPTETALTMTAPEAVPYTVSTTLADQKDLLYASASKDFTKADETAVVSLGFQHALAQVRFTAKTTEDYSAYYTVTLKTIELQEINSKANLKFSDGTWTSLTTPVSYSITYDKVLTATEVEMTNASNDVLMLIPQNPQDKSMVITLDVAAVENMGDSNLNGNKTVTLTVPATAWLSGYAYTYDITLNLDSTLGIVPSITDPTISEWKDGGKIPVNNK
ncbi:fimbrillin family protein [Alistipes sp. kh20]|uniref:fimbrillin family protein n=1 Tax=Alistipes montrealensis TaxID=2834113 RepID=UPI001BCFDD02|nr:fimbrillin family protein [Alistipes montrealensis]MBS4764806.1 fimbrillin family protein [Alistipes montrealensis]